jgi:inorganic pyrophosphatase
MAPDKLTHRPPSAAALTWGETLDWSSWEALIRQNGVTIDRPRGSLHPVHESIVYPMDYGFVNRTMSSDGEEIDVFVGTADLGLVGAIWTTDHRKADRECKFLLDCSPPEIYMIHGFLNFDRKLMEGEMVLRWPMAELWAGRRPGGSC